MIFIQHNIEVFDDLKTFADCALLMDLSLHVRITIRDSSGNVSTSGPTRASGSSTVNSESSRPHGSLGGYT